MFRLGYNTNGLAHHRILDALELLAELGYEGVAITPDVGALDPYDPVPGLAERVRARAEHSGLTLVVETGARFILDPRRKHHPTLLDQDRRDRDRRIEFLRRSIDLACELGAGMVSIWSGAAPGGRIASDVDHEDGERCWDRLCESLQVVLDHARSQEIAIAFEPEPGMFIERPLQVRELSRRLGAARTDLGLCLDVGHLLVTDDGPVADVISEFADLLMHVHLDDIAGGVHEHRMFGQGDLDLVATLRALLSVGYSGMAAVELSRDSHRGAQAAEEALARLHAAILDTT